MLILTRLLILWRFSERLCMSTLGCPQNPIAHTRSGCSSGSFSTSFCCIVEILPSNMEIFSLLQCKRNAAFCITRSAPGKRRLLERIFGAKWFEINLSGNYTTSTRIGQGVIAFWRLMHSAAPSCLFRVQRFNVFISITCVSLVCFYWLLVPKTHSVTLSGSKSSSRYTWNEKVTGSHGF